MKIEKAIQILSADESDRHPDTNPEVNEATKLGVEALKHYKRHRNAFNDPQGYTLPGETAD